jgi:hypothetical protein
MSNSSTHATNAFLFGDRHKIQWAEDAHKIEVAHMTDKVHPQTRFGKMDKKERKELKRRIAIFPNKNHTPVGFNVTKS